MSIEIDIDGNIQDVSIRDCNKQKNLAQLF